MKSHFVKKLLVTSVIAAVGSTAHAAGPTLSDVLKNSGIDVTGYIDTSYNSLSTDQGSFTGRAYDTERRSFNLHALDVAVSMLPEKGFGGSAELQFGTDTNFNRSANTGSATGSNSTDSLLQAFVQYASGPVTVQGGKFTTLAGAEVPQAPNNTNFSRSLLYTFAIPVTHTGARGTYTVSDKLKFMGGLNNGWDALQSSAKGGADGKTVELGVSSTPIKLLTLAASAYRGEEAGAINGTRTLLDVVATFNLSDAMNVVVNVDVAKQDDALAAGSDAKWSGVAGYFNYKMNDTWRLSARAEYFNDKNGFRTGTVQKIKELTATVGYAPAKNFELRGEVRHDKSDATSYTTDGTAKKSMNEVGVEAVLKF